MNYWIGRKCPLQSPGLRLLLEYEKSLAVNPDHEITLQNLVVAYREMGDAADLDKVTAKLKTVNPNNPALKN